MKKYLLGAFALVLAVGFTAFKMPSTTDVTFKYLAPGSSYSEANVESRSLTSWAPDATISCNNFSVKACKIIVPISETINGLGAELNSSKVTITATNDGGFEYVTAVSVSTGSATFTNKN